MIAVIPKVAAMGKTGRIVLRATGRAHKAAMMVIENLVPNPAAKVKQDHSAPMVMGLGHIVPRVTDHARNAVTTVTASLATNHAVTVNSQAVRQVTESSVISQLEIASFLTGLAARDKTALVGTMEIGPVAHAHRALKVQDRPVVIAEMHRRAANIQSVAMEHRAVP